MFLRFFDYSIHFDSDDLGYFNQMKLKFYLIPGMGADHRLYSNYDLPGDIHLVKWVPPQSSKCLADYSRLIAQQISNDTHNVIVGSSMGGMLAVELSKHVPNVLVILLSAPTGRHQFPWFLKALSLTRIHRLIGQNTLMKCVSICDVFMGFKTSDQRNLFYQMLHANGKDFLHFNLRAVLDWDNTEAPVGDYIQIIGDKDFLFNVKKITDAIPLTGSGHFSTFEKSLEICTIIHEELEKRGLIIKNVL